MKVLLICMILINFSLLLAQTINSKNNICSIIKKDRELVVTHLNGVQTEESDIDDIRSFYRDEFKKSDSKLLAEVEKDKVCFNNIYNETNGLGDFAEVFKQKLDDSVLKSASDIGVQIVQILITDKDAARYYFDTLSFESSLLLKLTAANSNIALATIAQVVQQAIKILKPELEKLAAEAAFTRELTIQNGLASLDDSRGDNDIPILLVSHSQGNLFANDIFDRYSAIDDDNLEFMSRSFASLQVASPAETVSAPIFNQYIHPSDLVINGLALIPPFKVQPSNFVFFFNSTAGGLTRDPAGHGFFPVYTNEDAYGTFNKVLLENRDEIVHPVQVITRPNGILNIELDYSKFEFRGQEFSLEGDERLERMSDVFYRLANDLAEVIVGIKVKDCNLDGIEDDPAFAYYSDNRGTGFVEKDPVTGELPVFPEGFTILDGARVCKGVQITATQGSLQGPETVLSGSTVIGDGCDDVFIFAASTSGTGNPLDLIGAVSVNNSKICVKKDPLDSPIGNVSIFVSQDRSIKKQDTALDNVTIEPSSITLTNSIIKDSVIEKGSQLLMRGSLVEDNSSISQWSDIVNSKLNKTKIVGTEYEIGDTQPSDYQGLRLYRVDLGSSNVSGRSYIQNSFDESDSSTLVLSDTTVENSRIQLYDDSTTEEDSSLTIDGGSSVLNSSIPIGGVASLSNTDVSQSYLNFTGVIKNTLIENDVGFNINNSSFISVDIQDSTIRGGVRMRGGHYIVSEGSLIEGSVNMSGSLTIMNSTFSGTGGAGGGTVSEPGVISNSSVLGSSSVFEGSKVLDSTVKGSSTVNGIVRNGAVVQDSNIVGDYSGPSAINSLVLGFCTKSVFNRVCENNVIRDKD